MDLALNNLQRLICHKTQTTNHQLFQSIIYNLDRVVLFQVFLSINNNHTIFRNHCLLITVICLHTVIWFKRKLIITWESPRGIVANVQD